MGNETEILEKVTSGDYKYGFTTDLDMDLAPKGLNEDIIRFISNKKNEPGFLLEWRFKAYKFWLDMKEPKWPNVTYPPIDYNDIIYYAAPKSKKKLGSLEDFRVLYMGITCANSSRR